MRVVVLGAGVIGVTTAWRLALAGHEVVVVDARERVAAEASSANAGMIAPGHAHPWASPGAPLLLLKALLGRSDKLRVRGPVDRDLARWGARFVRECAPGRARRNLLATLPLCLHSEALLHAWAREEAIDYSAERAGALYLHRSHAQLRAAYRRSAVVRGHGRRQDLLDADAVRSCEPALAAGPGSGIAGAIFDPGDSSGDAERFASELARRARGMGAELLLGRRVIGLTSAGSKVTGALLDDGTIEGDAYVIALGAGSAPVARTIGERLDIYPVKGYTATFPLRAGAPAPRVAGVDEAHLVAWSRQGERLRVSSGAEFAGWSRGFADADVEPIVAAARRLFPEAADYDAGTFRAELRPLTPDGLPILRRARHPNLFFNTGHGHLGWTLACGSAQVTAELVSRLAGKRNSRM